MNKWLMLLTAILLSSVCNGKVIHKEQSLYRNIMVTESNKKRCMGFSFRKQDSQNQSCKLVYRPDYLVFDYAKISAASILAVEEPKNILILGLGGGSLVEAFHELAPQATITSVEIDEAVIKVAKNYFDLPEADWHKVFAVDGRIFVKREKLKKAQYDIIILDAFNGDYIPAHMMTVEFLREVKSILSPNGLAIANTFSTSKLKKYESATYAKAFGKFYQFKGRHSGNRVIWAGNTDLPTPEKMKEKIPTFKVQFFKLGIDPDYIFDILETEVEINDPTKILTDDYAPVNILNEK
ncbi:MAG: fused MFS/spermidine synthase [Gammaproteobacteria bacterium]|nr:fused MFS/spermidine synthase [Gammaproteobacteria bacterium]MDH5629621.1 fused MFS/spermidine synthase [Gammaproteobacteria bacterium]